MSDQSQKSENQSAPDFPQGTWGNHDDAFVDELASWIGDRSVLEVFAGNGFLASKLAARGVDIVATSLFSGHDGHSYGLKFDVEEMEASEAVKTYSDRDILLMSWPVANESATKAALQWGGGKPIIFIGEVTNHDLGFGGLGGCASDLFFELTDETTTFSSYRAGNVLERAGVRILNLEAVRRWKHSFEEETNLAPGVDLLRK